MLLTNRLYEREPPSREAKSIYIFCEGAKREYQYFKYFKEMDSRINIEIYHLHPHEDNSPIGLLNIAKKCLVESETNPITKYRFQDNDEVWIILDVDEDKDDSRKPQVDEIRKFCGENMNWVVLQSNPCFEVWLHYHSFKARQRFQGDEICSNWKALVNDAYSGGFDSRRHPIFIQQATSNAMINFEYVDNEIGVGCTDVFKLGESMITILKDKIEKVLVEITE